MTDQDKAQMCELHDAPMFLLLTDTEMDGVTLKAGFGFCRYCINGHGFRCPECGYSGSLMAASMTRGNVHADSVFDDLACRKCEKVFARTGNLAGY